MVMALLVQKFGGTSVGSVERIQAVAKRVAAAREDGDDVVVVVSAMGHTTDELTALARALNPDPPQREMDMLLATGEQVSIALLSMALQAEGVAATSMTGPQVGIVTESAHGRARILEVRTERVKRRLHDGHVVVWENAVGVDASERQQHVLPHDAQRRQDQRRNVHSVRSDACDKVELRFMQLLALVRHDPGLRQLRRVDAQEPDLLALDPDRIAGADHLRSLAAKADTSKKFGALLHKLVAKYPAMIRKVADPQQEYWEKIMKEGIDKKASDEVVDGAEEDEDVEDLDAVADEL